MTPCHCDDVVSSENITSRSNIDGGYIDLTPRRAMSVTHSTGEQSFVYRFCGCGALETLRNSNHTMTWPSPKEFSWLTFRPNDACSITVCESRDFSWL